MALKTTVRRADFHEHMLAIRPNNFSREGLDILYDMLNDTGEDIEFDPIAICCYYAESTIGEVLDNDSEVRESVTEYATDLDISVEDVEADEVADILSARTYAVATGADTILYQQF